ncbi:MAG: inositol monophosphatase [Nitratiruptor sp.]|nr:inositol monophosphatase [Nitratiruptor sp.]NPA83985.1 inositol monophosphatase [Campylobacterota bacterium]
MEESYYRYEGVGAGGDRSSRIDLVAEEIFSKRLAPYGQIVSEERGSFGSGPYRIILDPIDGSDNLLSRFPYYGSSVAVMEDGQVVLSFIVNLANGEFFVKYGSLYQKGSLWHHRLKEVRTNLHARVGLFEKAYANPAIVQGLKDAGLKFRSPGAVALSLAYARYVRFVLFVGELREYDIRAGLHQCEGLHIHQESNAILVAKDPGLFHTIREILLRE